MPVTFWQKIYTLKKYYLFWNRTKYISNPYKLLQWFIVVVALDPGTVFGLLKSYKDRAVALL